METQTFDPAVGQSTTTYISGSDSQLGTIIGNDSTGQTIRTHNHYDPALDNSYITSQTISLDGYGGASSSGVTFGYHQYDGGTTDMFVPPNTISGIPASTTNTATISEGDYVYIAYNNSNDDIVWGAFEVTVANSNWRGVPAIQVHDPNVLCNPGISGGPAYFNGNHIGNSWELERIREGDLTSPIVDQYLWIALNP